MTIIVSTVTTVVTNVMLAGVLITWMRRLVRKQMFNPVPVAPQPLQTTTQPESPILPPRQQIHNLRFQNYEPHNLKMFIVTYDPSFVFQPHDEKLVNIAESLSIVMDSFIRKALAKILDESQLSLFIDTKAAIPFVDLELIIRSNFDRTMKISYKGKVLGQATIKTLIDARGASSLINHTLENVVI